MAQQHGRTASDHTDEARHHGRSAMAGMNSSMGSMNDDDDRDMSSNDEENENGEGNGRNMQQGNRSTRSS